MSRGTTPPRWISSGQVITIASSAAPIAAAMTSRRVSSGARIWVSGAVRAVRIELVDRDERSIRRLGSVLDRLATPGEPIHHRSDPGDLEALLPDPLDRPYRGSTGRHDVLDDEAAGARGENRPLDPAL